MQSTSIQSLQDMKINIGLKTRGGKITNEARRRSGTQPKEEFMDIPKLQSL